jgi:rhodanese-related sulfurtransferase
MPAIREITVNELSDLIAKHEDLKIVDVRESEQYAKGHIPGALSVPLGSIEHAADVTSVACNHQLVRARADTVVVCCDDERRSRVAATLLDRLGFLTVCCLAGGLTRWRAEGFPLVSG